MTFDQWAKIFELGQGLVATLAWPLVAIVALWKTGPAIGEFVSSLGDFTLKAGGVEATGHRRIEAAAALGAATANIAMRTSDEVGGKTNLMVMGASSASEEPSALRAIAPTAAAAIAEIVERFVTPKSFRRTSNTLVLWVDDHPENNRLERQALGAAGVRFVLSNSTADALEKLRHDHFDAIVSDISRKGDTNPAGIELLKKVRQMNKDMPFIFYTSRTSIQKNRSELENLKYDGATNRPDELLELVVSALGKR